MKEPRRKGSRRWRMGGAIYAVVLLLGGCATHPAAGRPPLTAAGPPASTWTGRDRTPQQLAAPLPAAGAPPFGRPYQIGAGDTLEVIVWNEDKVSGPVQVRPDGMISVALIGDVVAAGTTPEALASSIRAELSRFIDKPNVVVRVAATGSRRYFIVGNVKMPGTYDLRAEQTFLQALSVAGGFTDFARRSAVRVIRQNGKAAPTPVDYDAIIRGDAPDVRLEPNDTIIVP